jgi:cyclophilin family peptidyl-prolyl cis-trans isomerase/HEAT repeat protein
VPDESRRFNLERSVRRRGRAIVLAAWGVLVLSAWIQPGQSARVTRTELLRAEDARGKAPAGLQPVLDGLRDPALRPIAIRALGRLERPELVGHVIPFLSDPSHVEVAAEALAQSLRGLPPDSGRSAAQRVVLDSVFRLLAQRAQADARPASRSAIARSIGRLPYDDPRQARDADSLLITLGRVGPDQREEFPAVEGVAHGLYTLARARRALGPLSPAAVEWLRRASGLVADDADTGRIRRAAWLALTANGTVDAQDVFAAIANDPDPQVRRLAVAALPNVLDSAVQRQVLGRAMVDRSSMVRLEWVRVFRQLFAASGCTPLVAATRDTIHHVRLAAIDALGGPCPERERDAVVAMLKQAIETGPEGVAPRPSDGTSWHARAHALVALARADSAAVWPMLRRDARHPVWQVRMYVARAAAAVRDSITLTTLAFDSVGNVREAAIQGLSGTVGHLADLVYVRALASRDYHVVLAAARALRGAPVADSVRPAVIDALMRLSREQRQTSRDPRMELLARAREIGRARDADRLRVLLSDDDDRVAAEAASVIGTLTSSTKPDVTPRRSIRPVIPPSGIVQVRVTMAENSGGGSFDLDLDADQASMTVARVIGLIRTRYYDGLTFHRVVPNFVIQGGSPGMNEYVGDGPFMRDELGLAHHARGTVGISTRGRDTGDAQWFVNLVDNYRLDHDYTVFATIVRGMDVVDRILEGDAIATVRVTGNR